MKVYFFTHGKHQKGKETVESYDGPLTAEAKKMAAEIKLPEGYCPVFSGIMRRHLETVEAVGVKANATKLCGNDKDMFAMVDDNDIRPAEAFWNFLLDLKKAGNNEVVIVTSRGYLMLPFYFQGGGEKKFGKIGHFLNTIVAVSGWEGSKLPVMESGRVITLEI